MSEVKLDRAKLAPEGGAPIEVQFNPVSLVYEVSNSLDQQNRDGTRRQIVTQSNARLSVELQFDTTPSGHSVRTQTLQIKRLVRPDEVDTSKALDIVPPVVAFQWGSFIFSGLIESYRETLDFFSPEGVPLRAQVAIAMTHQARANEPARGQKRGTSLAQAVLGRCTPQAVDGAAGLAQRLAGASPTNLARYIARANGEESLRRTSRTALAVPESRRGVGEFAAARAGTGPSLVADVGRGTPLSQIFRFDE